MADGHLRPLALRPDRARGHGRQPFLGPGPSALAGILDLTGDRNLALGRFAAHVGWPTGAQVWGHVQLSPRQVLLARPGRWPPAAAHALTFTWPHDGRLRLPRGVIRLLTGPAPPRIIAVAHPHSATILLQALPR